MYNLILKVGKRIAGFRSRPLAHVNTPGIPPPKPTLLSTMKWAYTYSPEVRPLLNMINVVVASSIVFAAYEMTKWDLVFDKRTPFAPVERMKNRDTRRIADVHRPWKGNMDPEMEKMIVDIEQNWDLKSRADALEREHNNKVQRIKQKQKEALHMK